MRLLIIIVLDPNEGTEQDTLEFELKIKCSYNKEANKKDSSRVEDMYKNNNGKITLYIFSFFFRKIH